MSRLKNFNVKSLICGLLIGILGTIGITKAFAAEEIKLAKYENVKVSINNSIIPLKNSFVSIVKRGENDAKIYMPAMEILDHLGYNVEWNASEHSINIEGKAQNSICNDETAKNLQKDAVSKNTEGNQGDKLALEIMQKTGNWKYVEPLFPYMTPDGVKEVVDLYVREKGGSNKQTESASQYMNKDNFAARGCTQLKTQSDYDTLASEALSKTDDMFSILVYLPYMSKNKIDAMVKDYIDKTNNFNCIYNVHEYMSTRAIDDAVKSYINKTGDYGTVASILQFMSTDGSSYIAKKYISEAKDQQYRQLFTPYIK